MKTSLIRAYRFVAALTLVSFLAGSLLAQDNSNAKKKANNRQKNRLVGNWNATADLSNGESRKFILSIKKNKGKLSVISKGETREMRWTPMFGHLRGKLSYNGLLVWVSISSRAEGQVLAPQLFYFGRRNGRVSMQRNVVKWNTDPGMKTSKTAAGAIDLHAAFSLVPSLIPLSYMALGVSLPRAS